MAQVRMRCPRCSRIVDTFWSERPASNGDRMWKGDGEGRHPTGYDFNATFLGGGRPYRCHRKCWRSWVLDPKWLLEKIAAGRDFTLP